MWVIILRLFLDSISSPVYQQSVYCCVFYYLGCTDINIGTEKFVYREGIISGVCAADAGVVQVGF